MMTRYACALNGIPLHGIDDRIHVLDIVQLPPKMRIATADAPLEGTHLIHQTRASLTVRVSFLIREYDVVARRSILQQICAWAASGGTLTINDRPGQQLRVVCTDLPRYSAMAWLDELTLTFTAYEAPFWEDAAAASATVSGDAGSTGGTGTLAIPGTAGYTPVHCTAINRGTAPLTTITLEVSGSAITLEGLSIAAGGAVAVEMDGVHLRIHSAGSSLLHTRTATSSDRLLGCCGQENPVAARGDQPIEAMFSARGRYA